MQVETSVKINYTPLTVWCMKALRPAEETWVDQGGEGETSTHEDAGSVEWPVKKIKGPLVQALRLCTGCTACRGSRGIALTASVV